MTAPAPVIGITSTPRPTTYMSTDMFASNARRGVSIDQLVPKGSVADQLGALAEYIDESSNWMDHICQQILSATFDTVLAQVEVNGRGYAKIHPRYRPVVSVNAFAIGGQPEQLHAYTDLSMIGVTPDYFSVPANGSALPVFTNQGPIQLGSGAAPRDQAWCQYTYVNGYPVTYLAQPVTTGDTLIHLADCTGVIAGNTYLTIYTTPARRSTFLAGTVSAIAGPGTVVCPAQIYPVGNVGPYPTMVSALPRSCITACTLATRSFIKDSNPSASTGGKNGPTSDDDLAAAAALLRDFVAPIA